MLGRNGPRKCATHGGSKMVCRADRCGPHIGKETGPRSELGCRIKERKKGAVDLLPGRAWEKIEEGKKGVGPARDFRFERLLKLKNPLLFSKHFINCKMFWIQIKFEIWTTIIAI
jgi:hypothetical protein